MGTLVQLIYVSAATKPFTNDQLKDLLAKARTRNAERELTGLLVHEAGSFLQVLEGEPSAVQGLYDTLAKDPRHHGLKRLYEGSIEQRRFGDWSMGFASLAPAAAKSLVGYSDFFFNHAQPNAALDGDVAQRVLEAFREGRWRAAVDV
ncbi:MAG: BLUF domain-containing protein [Polyangiaceae bacterium]